MAIFLPAKGWPLRARCPNPSLSYSLLVLAFHGYSVSANYPVHHKAR
jgi:hypothetical protein